MEIIPKIHIETLTGKSNWVTWRSDILFTLCLLDYQSVISGTDAADLTAAGKDAVVKFIIETSVGTETKEHLSSCTTAKEMWDKLVLVYQPDAENALDVYTNLFKFSKNEEDSFADHARKLKNIYNDLNKELKQGGRMVLSQSVLMNKIMQILPADYLEFQNVWERVSQDQRNVTHLIEELCLFEQQLGKSQKGSCNKINYKRAAKSRETLNLIQTEIFSDGKKCELDSTKTVLPFFCETCCKPYEDKKKYKNHVRRIHKEKNFSCSTCEMKFTFQHKLKIHERSHSISKIYQVVCSLCGKGLSRGDKLRYHMLRYHTENNSAKSERRQLKVAGKKRVKFEKMTEEQLSKFSYKCEKCMVGYRRRGILVNHMAKRHPEISLDSVPCLTAPVLEMQKSFKCHYCWKTYMSHGKRKSHIKHNHPQAYLPVSSRYVDIHDVGALKIEPRKCSFCPKQFLKNAKLLQHLRKEHPLILFENENELVA